MSVRNLIIIEANSDAAFVNLLLAHVHAAQTELNVIETTAFEPMGRAEGSAEMRGKTALKEMLDEMKGDLLADKYKEVEHIGIILDMDSPPDWNFEENKKLINDAIGASMGTFPNFTGENSPVLVNTRIGGDNIPLSFSFFLMKDASGTGNLDTVLKAIAKGKNAATECLEQLSECVDGKIKTPLGNFEKQWVNLHLREVANKDQKSDWERRQHEIIRDRGADLFDLEHADIAPLRAYLAQFK